MRPGIDVDLIRRRTAARIDGRAIASMIIEESCRHPEDVRTAFLEVIVEQLALLLPKNSVPVVPEPLSEMAAKMFAESVIMPFGKFEGQAVGNVPLEYLVWLADDRSEFKADLQRYLKSPAVKRAIDLESEETTCDALR